MLLKGDIILCKEKL